MHVKHVCHIIDLWWHHLLGTTTVMVMIVVDVVVVIDIVIVVDVVVIVVSCCMVVMVVSGKKGDVTCHRQNYNQQTCACGCITSHDLFQAHVHMSCDSSHMLQSQDQSCLRILRTHSSPQECTPIGLKKLAGPSATIQWSCAVGISLVSVIFSFQ